MDQGKPLVSRFSGHKDAVYALAEGREGYFFSAGADGWVVEWQLNNPEQGRLLARMPGAVYTLLFLPLQNLLLVAVKDDGFHGLDVTEGKEIFALPASGKSWFRMQLLSDGSVLAAGSDGNLARFFPQSGQIQFLKFGQSNLRSMAVLSSGSQVFLGSSDAGLQLLKEDFSKSEMLLSGHEKTLFGLAVFPDGNGLISAGRDARLNLHRPDVSGNWQLQASIPAHLFAIHDVVMHPENRLLASASMDKTIKIWDADTLTLLRVLDRSRHQGHQHSVNQLCWLAKPDLLLSCSDDRTILAWDIYR